MDASLGMRIQQETVKCNVGSSHLRLSEQREVASWEKPLFHRHCCSNQALRNTEPRVLASLTQCSLTLNGGKGRESSPLLLLLSVSLSKEQGLLEEHCMYREVKGKHRVHFFEQHFHSSDLQCVCTPTTNASCVTSMIPHRNTLVFAL